MEKRDTQKVTFKFKKLFQFTKLSEYGMVHIKIQECLIFIKGGTVIINYDIGWFNEWYQYGIILVVCIFHLSLKQQWLLEKKAIGNKVYMEGQNTYTPYKVKTEHTYKQWH